MRAAGLFAWQLIVYLGFQSQQGDRDYEAISYAVTDRRTTATSAARSTSTPSKSSSTRSTTGSSRSSTPSSHTRSCRSSKARPASDTPRCASWAGRALDSGCRSTPRPAPSKWRASRMSAEAGSVDYAASARLNPNIGGILHWGQHNDATAADIQRLFGDISSPTNGHLGAWRQALADITDGGSRARFSNDFTRRTGLEP